MSYSSGFKINVNKLAADEKLLVLLDVNHPFLVNPIRFVCDNQDFVFNGNEYLASAFKIKRQDDIQGELPKVVLQVPNIGRALVKWIDQSGGGVGATIKVTLARRSAPSSVEEEITFGVETINIDTQVVTFNLVVQNNLVKRAVKWIYDTKRAPGLF